MAEQRKIKRKAKKQKPAASRKRRERRFLPETTRAVWATFALGMLGALALGAGVFGYWVKDPPIEYSVYLMAAGGIVVGLVLWFGDLSQVPVRIGDAGIAIERGTEIVRVAWCDLEKVSIERGQLLAKSAELNLSLPIAAHPQAIAWLLSEGTKRVPDVIGVKRRELKQLPAPDQDAGEVLVVEGIQLAGRHCRDSDKPISFEQDARVCPNCCEVYHRLHVPKLCLTCEQPLAERAFTP